MKVGVTLLFKEKESNNVKGVLKSTVIDSDASDLHKLANNKGLEIASHYNYEYLGINDLFTVSGEVKNGEVLGRATFYDLNDIEKSKSLISNNNFAYNPETASKSFNCSLVYFCQNINKESYTISILSILESVTINEVYTMAKSLAINNDFINKIKSNSIDDLHELEFIGIEDICDIKLDFNVFQTFYSDFETISALKKELLSKDELEDFLEDIFI